METDPKTGVPLLGSVKLENTERLSLEQRVDQLEEFARWVVRYLAHLDSEQQALDANMVHVAGSLEAILENAVALREVKVKADTRVDL